jgi:hypothetical protein
LFSPESSLGILEGRALGVGGIGVRGRGVLKGLLVGLVARREEGKDVPETNVGNIGGRLGESLEFGFERF